MEPLPRKNRTLGECTDCLVCGGEVVKLLSSKKTEWGTIWRYL